MSKSSCSIVLSPQEGAILIDGQMFAKSRENLRSHMGIVLQDPYLFTGTIASNVARVRIMHIGSGPRCLEKVGLAPL